jgi:hypothetical protein
MDTAVYYGETIERGNIPPKDWLLLQYAMKRDFDKIKRIKTLIKKEGKTLVTVYTSVLELMKGIDVSQMELIGHTNDVVLYLK